ncbi:MAG: hypothetical protein M1837_001868 [Sclerophora amabilis]|nr:MAG: hypothetical protein M1837_001868 [Sclerophora amabilis]
MSKRLEALAAIDSNPQSSKRRKLDTKVKTPKVEEVTSAAKLRQLLRSQQDSVAEYRHGVQSFRAFLKSIAKQGGPSNPAKEAILREYLESQKPRSENDQDQDDLFLTDLVQAWSFASFNHEDSLLAAIPASLALLLETISTKIDFREYGTRLCKTLLNVPQLKLIARGVSSNSSKDYLISPCIWLLTEIVSFDGGVLARRLYSHREFTFKSLAKNLGLRAAPAYDEGERRRKPSVRTNAVRYLLANLKYQDADSKGNLVGYRDIISALLKDLQYDVPELVINVLHTLRDSIFLDKTLSQHDKSRLLSDWSLKRIATLYDYDGFPNYNPDIKARVVDQVHSFLMLVCTSPSAGVLQHQNGWYPAEKDKSLQQRDAERDEDSVHCGTRPLDLPNNFSSRFPVRNKTLAAFAQSLRPYASSRHSELLLAMFKAAPELVADYFNKMQSFSYDPKLSMTWLGYSAFIFSSIQLPVPGPFGQGINPDQRPPPVLVVIESILPQPLNQKALTRCFNQNSALVSLFAIRVLTVAFQKLQTTLRLFRSASSHESDSWHDAIHQLRDEFCRRCPTLKDIIPAFRSVPEENILQRESFARLLAAYYEAVPQLALEERFDISVVVSRALKDAESAKGSADDDMFRLLELKHLLLVAQHSPSMRWWNRPEPTRLSPFTTMLKLFNRHCRPLWGFMKRVLENIAHEVGLLQGPKNKSTLLALITSFLDCKHTSHSNSTYEFVDHCIRQFIPKPVKYHDEFILHTSHEADQADGPASLFLFVLVEQWPFFTANETLSNEDKLQISRWLAMFLDYCRHVGESRLIISKLFHRLMMMAGEDKDSYNIFLERLNSKQEPSFNHSLEISETKKRGIFDMTGPVQDHPADTSDDGTTGADVPDLDLKAITRLLRKDVEQAVEDGDIGKVIMCLCSSEIGIRKQALSNIARCIATLESSKYAEKDMVTLLLQEIHHTAKESIDSHSFPSYLSSFAVKALQVEINPQHWLYGKINRFLHERPIWDVGKVPLLQKVLLHPPDVDGAHYDETRWMLEVVIDGLRTKTDLDAYRQSHVFERFLALTSSPYLASDLSKEINRLLCRASYIEGGCTTLMTRTGLLSWMRAQRAVEGQYDVTSLQHLATRMSKHWDHERVESWSGHTVNGYLSRILDKCPPHIFE